MGGNINMNNKQIRFNGGSGNNFLQGNVENTGRLGIFTENTERITIGLGGNVGIGTASPSSLLDVAGNFEVDGSDFFVNSTSGNVGIGTTSPNFKLDVDGKINATACNTNDASGAITTCTVGEIRCNTTANKICLCTTANNWKCATVS